MKRILIGVSSVMLLLAAAAWLFGAPTGAVFASTLNSKVSTSDKPAPAQSPTGFYIASVTLAKGVQGEQNVPVDPTGVFAATDTIHAVVQIQGAPANTVYTSTWFVVDVGQVAPPNTQIDTTSVTTDGSRNIDFNLTPPASNFPVGVYRVEFAVNGQKAAEILYTVR